MYTKDEFRKMITSTDEIIDNFILVLFSEDKGVNIYKVLGFEEVDETIYDTDEFYNCQIDKIIYASGDKQCKVDVGIIYDNTKKAICEDCFYEKEVKRLVENGNAKSATTKDYLNSKEVKDFVKSVENSTKKDITKMTNSKRISELEKLSNQKDPLTNKDMRYRDALWATAKDDSKWIDFRLGHVEKITKAIVDDKSYINNKRLWSIKSDKGKLDYFEIVLEKQQTIFGDKRTIGVGIKPHITNNPNSNGSYDDRKNKITIYNTSSGFDDFYKINSTMVHEYGGHGYQDYILENKKSFTKNNPQFNDTVKMFELSYDPKTWTRKGITYPNQSLNYSIYRSDPTERDAFYMGDSFKAKIIANDINSINKKITKNGK
jgi:hypothetical protein